MGSSSSPKPDVIHPGEAAQAAVGTAGAGEMMGIANQPIEQYANLYTTQQLGPAQMQTQQALANQAAYQGAVAQQDIQSRVDPMAYAQRQMRLKAATTKLGQLYGQDPNAFSFRGPSAYAIPGTADVAPLSTLRGAASDIAANLATGSVDKSGANPQLKVPAGVNLRYPTAAQSYF
jgi:hypothetical protein